MFSSKQSIISALELLKLELTVELEKMKAESFESLGRIDVLEQNINRLEKLIEFLKQKRGPNVT